MRFSSLLNRRSRDQPCYLAVKSVRVSDFVDIIKLFHPQKACLTLFLPNLPRSSIDYLAHGRRANAIHLKGLTALGLY